MSNWKNFHQWQKAKVCYAMHFGWVARQNTLEYRKVKYIKFGCLNPAQTISILDIDGLVQVDDFDHT